MITFTLTKNVAAAFLLCIEKLQLHRDYGKLWIDYCNDELKLVATNGHYMLVFRQPIETTSGTAFIKTLARDALTTVSKDGMKIELTDHEAVFSSAKKPAAIYPLGDCLFPNYRRAVTFDPTGAIVPSNKVFNFNYRFLASQAAHLLGVQQSHGAYSMQELRPFSNLLPIGGETNQAIFAISEGHARDINRAFTFIVEPLNLNDKDGVDLV
jgi:hypothetical protein